MKSHNSNNEPDTIEANGPRLETERLDGTRRRRLQRLLAASSTGLSTFGILLAVLAGYVTHVLETRAIWSGEAAPVAWRTAAQADDVFAVEGRTIAYWGDPDALYSKYATRKRRPPVAIVVHHTAAKPVKSLVTYGHVSDNNRGGASFGYHFYIGRDGQIVQGAPLGRRTNHIKFKTHKMRRDTAQHLWSGNTIALTLVGGCDPLMRPRWGQWQRCSDEFVTGAQLEAGLAVIRALQGKFGLICREVYGHGDLQFDRENFEGVRLSRLAREGCREVDETVALPVQAPAGSDLTGLSPAKSATSDATSSSIKSSAIKSSAKVTGASDS